MCLVLVYHLTINTERNSRRCMSTNISPPNTCTGLVWVQATRHSAEWKSSNIEVWKCINYLAKIPSVWTNEKLHNEDDKVKSEEIILKTAINSDISSAWTTITTIFAFFTNVMPFTHSAQHQRAQANRIHLRRCTGCHKSDKTEVCLSFQRLHEQ